MGRWETVAEINSLKMKAFGGIQGKHTRGGYWHWTPVC